jgi:hypothetical protein
MHTCAAPSCPGPRSSSAKHSRAAISAPWTSSINSSCSRAIRKTPRRESRSDRRCFTRRCGAGLRWRPHSSALPSSALPVGRPPSGRIFGRCAASTRANGGRSASEGAPLVIARTAIAPNLGAWVDEKLEALQPRRHAPRGSARSGVRLSEAPGEAVAFLPGIEFATGTIRVRRSWQGPRAAEFRCYRVSRCR